MGAAEIVLIIVGAVILILGYVLPGQKEKPGDTSFGIDEGQIKELVNKEVNNAKKHIGDVVDETVAYSMEKTERAMERLTNEKIMAVNEYSDLVLEAINKNHNEVVFLYDMLNDKHEHLVSAVSEASKRTKEIQQSVQEAETQEKKETIAAQEERGPGQPAGDTVIHTEEFMPIVPEKVEVKKTTRRRGKAQPKEMKIIESAAETKEEKEPAERIAGNNNEKILKLHKLGKPDTAIAKELGLGVGEVKLVIDLYKQA